PSIVIPMHYNQEGLDQKTFGALGDLQTFLKEIGAEDVQPIEKLSIKKEQLDPENMKVVVLSI
ncbi:Zn-dependent hydrolase, partial [Candidatus Woesebacteria bacterium]|nr:Zn-dependent hydrolase [Candidatus Woesebacteria bacterium]